MAEKKKWRKESIETPISPLVDQDLRKPSLTSVTVEERRKWESMFARFHQPHSEILEQAAAAATIQITNVTQEVTLPASKCYWTKVGDDVWYDEGDVYCQYELIILDLGRGHDPVLKFGLGDPNVVQYTMGVDDSDNDTLKIETGTVLGGTDVEKSIFSIHPTTGLGLVTHNTDDDTEASLYLIPYPGEIAGLVTGPNDDDYSAITAVVDNINLITTLTTVHTGYAESDVIREASIDIDLDTGVYIRTWNQLINSSTIASSILLEHEGYLHIYGSVSVDINAPTTTILAGQELRFQDTDASNSVGFKAPALTGNVTWALPATDSTGTQALVSDGGGALSWLTPAPVGAKYIVQEADGTLTDEQSLGALATGILKNTTTAGVGVLSIATGSDLPAHNILSATHGDTLADTVVDGDIIIGNVTPKWSRLAISVPAANVRNVFGVDNGETRPSWKTALDATAPTDVSAGGSAAAGTSLVFAHRDHAHGAPATWTPAAHNHDSSYISIIAAPGENKFPYQTAGGELVDSTYNAASFDAAGAAAGAVSTHEGTYNHANIAHGETAYGWGDHSALLSPTYLTATAEGALSGEVNLGALATGLLKGTVAAGVSTISAVTDNSGNWNTAYGWGNHASAGYLTSVTAHSLLSATHGDTTAASVVRGDIITGQGASPNTKWARLAIGAANTIPKSDGTDIAYDALLGIPALTDPGADRVFFWDDSETASKWLACGDSIAITTTTLDTIQDIRTTAGPTFDHLHITNNIEFPTNSSSVLYKRANTTQSIIYGSRSDGTWDHYLQYNGWAGYIFTGGLGVGGYDPGQTDFLLVNGKVGINDAAPSEYLDVNGNANVTGVYKVDDVQVVQNRQAAIAEPAETTAANTAAIKYILDTLDAHGLLTAQEKVSNGGFDSTTTGWTALDGIYECTIASVAGGQSGNCLEITRVVGDAQACTQTVSGLVIGLTYTISAYVKSGTSGNGVYQIWTSSYGSVEGTSSNSWVFNSDSFVATGTTEEIRVWKHTADAGTMLFDTVSLKVTQ